MKKRCPTYISVSYLGLLLPLPESHPPITKSRWRKAVAESNGLSSASPSSRNAGRLSHVRLGEENIFQKPPADFQLHFTGQNLSPFPFLEKLFTKETILAHLVYIHHHSHLGQAGCHTNESRFGIYNRSCKYSICYSN